MKYSLSTRLTYRIMAVVLAMMAIIAGVVYYTVKEYMLDEAKERYRNMLLNSHEELRRHLSDVYVAVKNNAHDIERDLDHPDLMFDHLERIAKQNSTMSGCAILFEPKYYPSKGRVFIPCARKDSTGKVVVSRIDSTYHGYFYDGWLKRQLRVDMADWTKAYFESKEFAGSDKQHLLTTYAMPLHNRDGSRVALLAADMPLERLRDEMMEDVEKMNAQFKGKKGHQAYSFVINQDSVYIIHPERERMLRDTLKTDCRMRGEQGAATCIIDGEPSWIYYRKVKHVEWTMVIVVPDDVILFNGRMLNITILLTMIFGLLAIYLFCRHQIKEIADPFAAQKAALERELKIAHDIQMAMLPKALNTQQSTPNNSIDLFASLTPARDVGGDLYDYFLSDNRFFFCIGDVTGKGVPAALLMALTRALFRSEARHKDSAAAIVETINNSLCEESSTDYFVTMFVGILDLTTGHLDYCNAGHEAPLLSAAALPVKPNLPIGALDDWSYEGQQAQLAPGDMLFLYTDGLSESKNSADEQLGRKHVLELARQHGSGSPKQLVETMQQEVRRHAAEEEQSDDITLLAIRWEPDSQLSNHNCQLTMRATMDDIDQMDAFIADAIQQAELNDSEGKRLRLAVEEAVANVINHGQATVIRLHTMVDDNRLVLTIDDDGQPFDPTADSPTDMSIPADQRPAGGLGIMLIHQMADGLSYQRVEGHNVLKITKVNRQDNN